MKRYLKTVKPDEAVKETLESVRAIEGAERLAVYECRGRITAETLYAKLSNPPFLCAAMDGYAVSFEKTLEADLTNPVDLEKSGDVIPVNTGDPLPSGMNAVIMVEDVEEYPSHIAIRKSVYLWQNVRMIGEDIIEGDMLLPINHTITAFDTGMIISAGVTHISVRRKARAAIIPTGKELIDIFKEPLDQRGELKLIDFNSYTLKSQAEELGYEVCISDIACDKETLRATVIEALEKNDVVLVNAGTSAGREDYTEGIINDLGKVVFHGVSMMPGKPAIFGLIGGKPVFGIPGYPVSAAVTFRTFLVPLYEKLMTVKMYKQNLDCVMAYKTASRVGIEELIRVNLIDNNGTYFAVPLSRGASLFSSMAKADGIIRIPENTEGYEEGEKVSCELLRSEEEIAGRIHIMGSHDLSLDVVRDMVKAGRPGTDLISTHTGSLSGIMALRNGITPLATTHILDEKEKVYNVPAIRRYLPGEAVRLIHIAKRMQGLFVAQGNPKNIRGLADLNRPDVKFVNRQFGSGTRILLDSMLAEAGLDKNTINGYDREESSHTAVGVLVKGFVADAGVGIYSVARAFSLDFVPLAEEEYDLLVTKTFMNDKRFTMLMDIVTSVEFAKRLNNMGGYNTKETGKVKYEQP
jgi:putative molybdopterin biosynthesis protein